jgi:chromate transporter
VGLVAVVVSVAAVNELLILAGAGLFVMTLRMIAGKPRGNGKAALFAPLPFWDSGRDSLLAAASAGTATGTAAAFGLWPLFLFFLKVGAILYGSGYVLLAFLRADLVERWHWLTEAQLLDAIAVGQITPGPLFTTATFVGYVLGGVPAAALATLGIFLPAFLFVAISGPIIPHLRSSALASAFLDGVVVASLALMAVVSWHLGRAALRDVPTVLLALASGVLLIRFRVNSAWLVLGGAAVGLVISWGGR